MRSGEAREARTSQMEAPQTSATMERDPGIDRGDLLWDAGSTTSPNRFNLRSRKD